MDKKAWQRAQALFDEAIHTAAGARSALVSEACAGEPELQAEVVKLLRAHEAAGEFLADPTVATPELRDPLPATMATLEAPGARIGPYRLLEQIGEGGFGLVFMAEQDQPIRRRVALKIIKAGMDTKHIIARFEAERQALALMDHPHIARVLDAGATQTGRPYFVMELVRGSPLTQYCDDHQLSPRQRLELFMAVCQAVQHAHQKGIIHRDLKPSNVLVTVADARPVPKVIDFGVAKALHQRLTDKTLFTGLQQMIGTPAYMSPEQADLGAVDIDTRSDIYALGVLLYELLTGTTPFDPQTFQNATFDEMRRIIREVVPPTPSTRISTLISRPSPTGGGTSADDSRGQPLADDRVVGDASSVVEIARHRDTDPAALSRLLHGELDWIVMKCLEKDRTRRYETASALAEDVQRHLAGELVVAAPPSRWYALRKFVRRNRGMALSASLVLAMLILGLVGTSFGLISARHERDQKELVRKAEQAQRLESDRVTGVLEELLLRDNWYTKRGRSLLTPQQLDEFATNHLGGLSDLPRAEARLRAAIGVAYCGFDLDKARLHLAKALEIRRREFGDHFLTARSLIDWARMCNEAGDYEGADRVLKEALRIQESLSGPERADMASTLLTQAYTEKCRGHPENSIVLAKRALAIQRDVFGQDHTDIADTLLTLADYLAESRQFERAESSAREGLEMDRRLWGNVHLDVAYCLHTLGNILRQRGEFTPSEAALRQSLAIVEKLYGPEDREAIGPLDDLARTLIDAGRIDDAIAVGRRSHALSRKLYGDEDPRTAKALSELSANLAAHGRADEGVALMSEHLDVLEHAHPGDDPAVAASLVPFSVRQFRSSRSFMLHGARPYGDAGTISNSSG